MEGHQLLSAVSNVDSSCCQSIELVASLGSSDCWISSSHFLNPRPTHNKKDETELLDGLHKLLHIVGVVGGHQRLECVLLVEQHKELLAKLGLIAIVELLLLLPGEFYGAGNLDRTTWVHLSKV
jgi:hypothetical protein